MRPFRLRPCAFIFFLRLLRMVQPQMIRKIYYIDKSRSILRQEFLSILRGSLGWSQRAKLRQLAHCLAGKLIPRDGGDRTYCGPPRMDGRRTRWAGAHRRGIERNRARGSFLDENGGGSGVRSQAVKTKIESDGGQAVDIRCALRVGRARCSPRRSRPACGAWKAQLTLSNH